MGNRKSEALRQRPIERVPESTLVLSNMKYGFYIEGKQQERAGVHLGYVYFGTKEITLTRSAEKAIDTVLQSIVDTLQEWGIQVKGKEKVERSEPRDHLFEEGWIGRRFEFSFQITGHHDPRRSKAPNNRELANGRGRTVANYIVSKIKKLDHGDRIECINQFSDSNSTPVLALQEGKDVVININYRGIEQPNAAPPTTTPFPYDMCAGIEFHGVLRTDKVNRCSIKELENEHGRVWVGAGVAGSTDLMVGVHSAYGLIASRGKDGTGIEYVPIRISGWEIGFGVGVSLNAVAILAIGFPTAESLKNAVADGADFNLAIGFANLGATIKAIGQASKLLTIKKMFDYPKVSQALGAASLAGISGMRGSRIYVIPLPAAGGGLHIWGGYKYGTVEVLTDEDWFYQAIEMRRVHDRITAVIDKAEEKYGAVEKLELKGSRTSADWTSVAVRRLKERRTGDDIISQNVKNIVVERLDYRPLLADGIRVQKLVTRDPSDNRRFFVTVLWSGDNFELQAFKTKKRRYYLYTSYRLRPLRSLYVEADESGNAKKFVWDPTAGRYGDYVLSSSQYKIRISDVGKQKSELGSEEDHEVMNESAPLELP